jgi:phage shock protein A
VAWSITSDIRWKDKVRELPYGLAFLKDLRPVDYIRKNNTSQTRETGFIAQEVEQALIKNNYTDQGMLTKSDTGYLEIRYNDFIAMLVRAVQEISGTIDTLTTRVDTHDQEISKLKSENAALLHRLEAIEKQLQK